MNLRQLRIVVGSISSATLLLSVFVTPVAAACALSGPASVDIGSALTITGSGFPATTTVDVSMTVDGGSPDEFTVESDGVGGFAINLTPEAADAGLTTVVATAGAGCTAQVIIGVGVPAPAVTAQPTSDAEAADAPPRTDADAITTSSAPASHPAAWLLAAIMILLGLGGLFATRPARNR
jgi:hypothetical protein